MTCVEARDALLEADLGDLGSTDPATALGAHLAACAQCRRLAAAVASDSSRLAVLLDGRTRVRARATRRRRIALLATLPIAAALLFVLVFDGREALVDTPPARTAQRPVARQVSLTVEPGQRATVLKTADPKVTVIWLSPGDGQ